MQNSDVKVFCN